MSGSPPKPNRPRYAVFRGGERQVVEPRSGPAPPGPSAPRRPPPAAPRTLGATGFGVAATMTGRAAPQDAKGRIVVGVNALDTAVTQGTLITYGLGSCIAVVLFDSGSHIGAMCHFMLPSSAQDPRRAAGQPLMFGDLAIASLMAAFTRRGGNLNSVEAYVAGGASLAGMNDLFDIGGRNAKIARATLARFNITIRGAETGGRASRTVTLDVASGQVVINTPGLTPRRLR